MRLSWNEIRVRATSFSDKWKSAGNENSDREELLNSETLDDALS
jgi:hypothetical protein